MTNSGYKARSRYNPVKVSSQIIEVVNHLTDAGYIDMLRGFHDRRIGAGRTTRIWPTPLLTALFEQVKARGLTTIGHAPGTEVIILRDPKGNAAEYDDTAETTQMRASLNAYNALLAKAFIDIPDLELPKIDLADGRSLTIKQRDQLVRRVFNRGSWDKGGRFFGVGGSAAPRSGARRSSSTTSQRWRTTTPASTSSCSMPGWASTTGPPSA